MHEAVVSELDFFILCIDTAALLDNRARQSIAAHISLDAFVQHRQLNGLVSSVIDNEVMSEVGFLSTNKHIL